MTFEDRQLNSMTFHVWEMKFLNFTTFQVFHDLYGPRVWNFGARFSGAILWGKQVVSSRNVGYFRLKDSIPASSFGARNASDAQGTRQTTCCIYLYTSINAQNSTGSGVLIAQLALRRFDKNDLLHRKVWTFSIYTKKFNKVKAVNLQTAKNSKKSMIVINSK